MAAYRDRHAPEGVRDAGFDVADGQVFEIVGVPPWLGEVVKAMIAKLIALRMPGGPSSKMVPHMVSVWCEALMAVNIQWNETLDKPRLRAAWKAMLPTLDQWPTPAQFLRHMPARAPKTALPRPARSQEVKERACASLTRIADILKKGGVHDARGEN